MRNKFVAAALLITFSIGVNPTKAQEDKISQAVEVVRSLCLVGTEYDISADATGNIRILSTRPKGQGSLNFNVRSAQGNPIDGPADLRIIADSEVRDCTNKHISRIIDAIFQENPPPVNDVSSDYKTLRGAKFIGFVPDAVRVEDYIGETDTQYFYRFSVSKPSKVKVIVRETDETLRVKLYTHKGEMIESSHLSAKSGLSRRVFPGDYVVGIQPYHTVSYFVFDVVADKL